MSFEECASSTAKRDCAQYQTSSCFTTMKCQILRRNIKIMNTKFDYQKFPKYSSVNICIQVKFKHRGLKYWFFMLMFTSICPRKCYINQLYVLNLESRFKGLVSKYQALGSFICQVNI